MFNDLEPNIEILTEGFSLLKNSDKFKTILEYSLAFGNYLNGTSARGGAFAFKLGKNKK
jgi:hypothetical protein